MILFLFLVSLLSTSFSQNINGGCERRQQDIVFLIDTSTSVRDSNPVDFEDDTDSDNWFKVRQFVSYVVSVLTTSKSSAFLPRISFVTFATDVFESTPLTGDVVQLNQSIYNLTYTGGSTNIAAGLRKSREILLRDSNGKSKVIVLMTDGQSNVERENTTIESTRNKQMNITQCAVGITDFIDPVELKNISTRPEYFLKAANFSHLNSFINRLLSILDCPAPPPPPICKSKADIAILLDQSGSITDTNDGNFPENWTIMKSFVTNITNYFLMDENHAQFSLLTFNGQVAVSFRFKENLNATGIQERLRNLSAPSGQTNTPGALDIMTYDLFSTKSGNRPDATNVGILITDGTPYLHFANRTEINTAIKEAKVAKANKIILYAVGLTKDINMTELRASVSEPVDTHLFTSKTIPNIYDILSSLVIGVCKETTGSDRSIICSNQTLDWKNNKGMVLVGHDNFKYFNITNAEACKQKCIETYSCRSLEYMADYEECYLSYFVSSDFPDDFLIDSQVDYYQVSCV